MTLHEETWSWRLERIPEGLLLDVLCGTVGIYNRTVLLTPEEVDMWEGGGPAALEPLCILVAAGVAFDDSLWQSGAGWRAAGAALLVVFMAMAGLAGYSAVRGQRRHVESKHPTW